jgi:hypothetical protein
MGMKFEIKNLPNPYFRFSNFSEFGFFPSLITT